MKNKAAQELAQKSLEKRGLTTMTPQELSKYMSEIRRKGIEKKRLQAQADI